MATLSTVNVKITGDTGQLVTSLTTAEGRVKSFASSVTNAGRVTDVQARGLSNLGRAFTNAAGQTGVLNSEISILASSMGNIGLTAVAGGIALGALAGGLGASIKASIDFETAITRVAKTANFSKEETKAFGDEILSMSRRLPVATSSLTSIAVVAGQLGIVGTKNIARFVEEVAKLESTTGVSADALATSLGTLIQVSGLPVDAIDNISSAITHLGNTSNSTEQQILDFATRLVGVGTALDVPLADILAISSAFAAAGVPAERGGTAIQNILIALEEAAQESGDALRLIADVSGLTVDQFRELERTDPGIAFAKFVEGLAGIENVIPVLEALEIADARIVASALSAANAQAGIIGPINQSRQAAIDATATNDEFARSSETTVAKLQILKNNINATGVEIGTVFLPAINATLDVLNAFAGDLPEDIQGVRGDIDDLVASFGSLASAISDLHPAIATLEELQDEIEDLKALMPGVNRLFGDLKDNIDALTPGPVDAVTSAVGRLADSLFNLPKATDFIPVFGPVARTIEQAADVANFFGGGSDEEIRGPVLTPSEIADLQEVERTAQRAALADVDSRKIPIPPSLLPKGPSGPEPLTVEKALSDHVISLVEALTLGLSDAEVVALELADARAQEEAAAFRSSIELRKLADLFPGMTGEQVQFALAMAAIEQNLRETNRTAEEFRLAEAVGPELDRLQSRLQEVLGQPTRETLGLQRQRAVLERRRLALLTSGAADDDKRIKAIDAEIEGLNNLIRLRETEVDIMRIDAQLADQRTLSDRAQVDQTLLLTAATSLVSTEFSHLQGAAYLAASALERVGTAGGAEPLSLQDALIALSKLPDHGASLIPQLDHGGTVLKTGLAIVDRGERFFNNGFGPRGESGVTNYSQITNIYVTANTKNDADEIANVVAERLLRQQRQSDRRGHFVMTGGGFP